MGRRLNTKRSNTINPKFGYMYKIIIKDKGRDRGAT